MALLLLGMLPSDLKVHRLSVRAVAVPFATASAALALLSYSVLNWAWPPVGFEASGLVWSLSRMAALVCIVVAAALTLYGLLRARKRSHKAACGLTPPSSGQATAGFACFPLAAHVER